MDTRTKPRLATFITVVEVDNVILAVTTIGGFRVTTIGVAVTTIGGFGIRARLDLRVRFQYGQFNTKLMEKGFLLLDAFAKELPLGFSAFLG